MDQESIYIGNRYVPKIEGEWSQLKEYEGLSIVTLNGGSYTSKKRVPEGVAISNKDYWVKTGDSNGELIEFKEEVTAQLEETKYHHKIDTVLAKMQRKEPVIIVCFGDSMTWGYVSSGVEVAEPYPQVLQRKLRYLYGYDGITVINAGMPGLSSTGGLGNYAGKVTPHMPDIVVLMWGLNDNTGVLDIDKFQNNIRDMIAKGNLNNSKTILLTPTPTNQVDSQYNLENINYTKSILTIAKEKDCDYVDMNAHFSLLFKKNAMDQRSYENGSVHFKQEGYTLIADILIKELLYPYMRSDYENDEFLSFQSPFVKNNVTTALIRPTSKLQKFFYLKNTAPTQNIGFLIYNDTPNAKFKLITTRDTTAGSIILTNFGTDAVSLNGNGSSLIDYEIEISMDLGLNYFELLGSTVESGKLFITSGGYIKKDISTSSQITYSALALSNSWVNFEGAYEYASYFKTVDGLVGTSGMIKGGNVGSGVVIATLPVGYRSKKTHLYSVPTSDGTTIGTGMVEVLNTGEITARSNLMNVYVSLDSIRFLSEQ